MKANPGIWLVGAAGMLGRQLAREFAGRDFALVASDREVDIRDAAALERVFAAARPSVVAHQAALAATTP